jgi:hypothetical protein
MSLIPDQSYSFPDHFLRSASRARAAKDKTTAPTPVKLEPARPRPPARTPVPVSPRTAALPKARVNLRPPAASPSARPAPPAKPVHAPRAPVARAKIDIVPPRAAVRKYSDDEVQMEMFSAKETRSSKPRRSKFLRLMAAEAVALAVLLPSATLVLTRYLTDPTLILITNIVAITAAITAAMIPIILFAIAPTIPRGQ